MTLEEETLKLMDSKQKELVSTQWQKHQHMDFEIDFDVSGEKDILNGFTIKKGGVEPVFSFWRISCTILILSFKFISRKKCY